MNKTLQFRTIFTLVAALFIFVGAQAQSGSKNSKKNSSKTIKIDKNSTTEDATEKAEGEEVEYYYSYLVLTVTNKPGNLNLTMDKETIEMGIELPKDQVQIAKKAASGGLTFKSETELLNFMADANYEFVTARDYFDNTVPMLKMYFKVQIER